MFLGFIGTIGFFIAAYFCLFKSQDLGFMKYILLAFVYGATIFPVILYSSIGIVYSWYKADWLYENLGWIFLAQIVFVQVLYFCGVIIIRITEWRS